MVDKTQNKLLGCCVKISHIRIKLKSKWIKNLNIKPEYTEPNRREIGNSLEFIGTGIDFLN